MRRLTGMWMLLLMTATGLVMAQAPDAKTVLAGMQQALGGADKVMAVKTLTAKGVIRRVTPRGTTENETELSMQLPDKYMTRTVVAGTGSMAIYRNIGFNGEGLINLTDAPPNLAQGMASRLTSDRIRPGAGGSELSPEEQAAITQRQVLNQKKDFARLALAMLGGTYEGFPLELAYGGEAESDDGVAQIIEAKGAGDFNARLFIDTKTHLPLMLMWQDPGAGPNAGRMIERRIFYADFKKAGDLTLPHTFRLTVDGNATQETAYSEIRINPNIDAKIFEVSK